MAPPFTSSAGSIPEPSYDGYFRLKFDAFTELTFTRKLAWQDADLRDALCEESIPAHRAGYCEWNTGDGRAISIGWVWFAISDGSMFISPGCINSNLMLVDEKHYDVGTFRTSELLRAWLSSVSWKPERILEQI